MTAPESRDAQSGVEEVLAGVLAEHRAYGDYDGDLEQCGCGWKPSEVAWEEPFGEELEHEAHVAAMQAAALAPLIAGERAKALREAAERWADYEFVEIAWLRERAEQIEAATDAPQAAVAPNSTAVDPGATEGERGRESGGNEEDQ